jgi:hypothetical protein
MNTKNCKVDVVSVSMEHKPGFELKPTFYDLLIHRDVVKKEIGVSNRNVHFSIIDDNDNYFIGFLRSTIDKDLPAKIDKTTKKVSQLDVKENEGLAFGNIFLYSKDLKCLFFEVNRNSIYLNSFADFLYKCHSESTELKEKTGFKIIFGTIFRKKEYERAIKMESYKCFRLKVHQPAKLLHDIHEINSILEERIETEFLSPLKQAAELNTDIAEIEFNVSRSNLKKNGGLRKGKILPIIESFKNLLGYDQVRENIDVVEISGYTSESKSQQGINLIGDVYHTSFKLSVPRLGSSLQKKERKECILKIYEKELPILKDYI